jgi:hypothetical protein
MYLLLKNSNYLMSRNMERYLMFFLVSSLFDCVHKRCSGRGNVGGRTPKRGGVSSVANDSPEIREKSCRHR